MGNTYSVISLMVPIIILNKVNICNQVNLDESVYFCVVYTGCESSLPTFALQISGTLLGCFLSNGPVSVSSAGLSTLLGNAVSFALSDVGFGLSLTGEFEKTFELYDGSKKNGKLKGNFYTHVAFDSSVLVPKDLEEYLDLGLDLMVVFQIGDGSVTETMRDLFSSGNPIDAVKTISKASLAGEGSIELTLKLGDLTYDLLPNLNMGDLAKVDLVLSTQTLKEGVLPGMYLYVSSGGDFLVAVVKYAMHNFASLISKIAPPGTEDALRDAADASASTLKGSLAFGLWFNTNSFGFLMNFPALVPLFGRITLTCKVKLMTIDITCGMGYDFPEWITAIWDGVKLISGAMKGAAKMILGGAVKVFNEAVEVAEGAVGHAVEQVGKHVAKVGKAAERGVKQVEKWCEDLGKGALNVLEDVGDGFVTVGSGTVKAAEAVGTGTVKAAEAVGTGAVKAAETVGTGTVKAAEVVGTGTAKAIETVFGGGGFR